MEVDVPDDDMGPILDAQSKLQKEIAAGTKPAGSTLEAYFVTATDPEHRYPGFVRRISAKAETVEAKHVVKVTVGFTEKVRNDFLSRNQTLRPGSEVRARVKCGEARLAYVLLRDVVHVFYETVLFRWPFLAVSGPTGQARVGPFPTEHPPFGFIDHQPRSLAMPLTRKAVALSLGLSAILSAATIAQSPKPGQTSADTSSSSKTRPWTGSRSRTSRPSAKA